MAWGHNTGKADEGLYGGGRNDFYMNEDELSKVEFNRLPEETAEEKQARLAANKTVSHRNSIFDTSMMANVDYSPPLRNMERKEKDRAQREKAKYIRYMYKTAMGGGPSYDPYRPQPQPGEVGTLSEVHDVSSEMMASSNPQLHMAAERKDKGYKELYYSPYWSEAKKRDWAAQQDKTHGATTNRVMAFKGEVHARTDDAMRYGIKQVYGDEVVEWEWEAAQGKGQKSQLMYVGGVPTSAVRDVVRHGIATKAHGLSGATLYEVVYSGGQTSDYNNNAEASRFARSLPAGADFDKEWAKAVFQEAQFPGSTGLNLDFPLHASESDEPTGINLGLISQSARNIFGNDL